MNDECKDRVGARKAVLAVILLSLSLTACGGGGGGAGGSSGDTDPSPDGNDDPDTTVQKNWDDMKWDEGQWT